MSIETSSIETPSVELPASETWVASDIPPRVSKAIRVSAPDHEGITVVKNNRKRSYMRLGQHEAFLLSVLDGKKSLQQIADCFEQEFGESVTGEEVRDFVILAEKQGLLKKKRRSRRSEPKPEQPVGVAELYRRTVKAAKKQSPLFFRVKLFDPNATLNWLEPKTRFLFSTSLVVIAAVTGMMALGIVFVERAQLVQQFTANFGLTALFVAWVTTIGITILHEYGHGLACKRYGGDVHEMGALWIFFTPCFYCNVSDAWLLPSRWKRLLISMAGTYVDFLIWIVAVFVWRLSALDSALNFAAWVIVTTCGLRVAFNLNPLMRLDGYYALSDYLRIHNLRKRARAHWLGYWRWILWGAQRPAPNSENRALLIYGAANWIFAVGFLAIMSFQASLYLRSLMGVGSIIAAFGAFSLLTKKYFVGSLGEDFRSMFHARKVRVIVWVAVLAGLMAIPIHDRAGGEFHVRPLVRREVRAPIAGFLREIKSDEGDLVAAEQTLFVIEVPELVSNIARKKSEINESEANLRRLTCGPRPEQIVDQKEKIKRAAAWRDLGKHDLEKAREAFASEMDSQQVNIQRESAKQKYWATILQDMKTLHKAGGLAGQQLLTYERNLSDARLNATQAEAAMRTKDAEGVLKYESELARREKELADAEAVLTLLEAGTRHEDIEAEEARLARLKEELNHLLSQSEKQTVHCPVGGTIITPRLKELVGTYATQGMPLCVIEDLDRLEAEISVSEKDARVLVAGQPITLKPRSLPFERLTATVDRIAPVAKANELTSARTVTVYCTVENSDGALRTGMTGFGRIKSERRPLGQLLFNSVVRLLRSEFFW